mgnify:CR=1 FL=1|tara:strand:- start:672 stop:1109 length:438 start_codon:yes stop_codon:yes gene_type:complete
MKKSELKEMLKPLIRDCIKEVIFEDGVLSGIISEVVQGLSKEVIVEQRAHSAQQNTSAKPAPAVRQQLTETKKKMLAAMGENAYGGIDLFEGTAPMSTSGNDPPASVGNPMAGRPPGDAGIDISGIMAVGNASNWGALATGKKDG